MDVDRPRIAVVIEAPDLVKELIAGKDPVGVARKVIDELQLFGRGVYTLAVNYQLVIRQVDGELVIVDLLDRRVRARAAAAQHGAITSLASKGLTT